MIAAQLVKISITKKTALLIKKTTLTQNDDIKYSTYRDTDPP